MAITMRPISNPIKTIKTGISNMGNQMGNLLNILFVPQMARIRIKTTKGTIKNQ
jgi:hypothetical protein